MKNGKLIRAGSAKRSPVKTGAIAAPVVLATDVMPAVADRSLALTIAMTYDCRVGTSIWLMLKRSSRTTIAEDRFGISGTRINKTLDGRCVKTMVFTKPNFDARRDASSAEIPANTFA